MFGVVYFTESLVLFSMNFKKLYENDSVSTSLLAVKHHSGYMDASIVVCVFFRTFILDANSQTC